MKVVYTDKGEVVIRPMSLRDLDMAMRTSAKMRKEGYSDEVAELVANIMHGVDEAPFPLTEDGILDLDMATSLTIMEAVGEVNDPLGNQKNTASESAD